MRPRTIIVDNKIVNCVEQLACYLKQGDLFRKPRCSAQYKFEKLLPEQKLVVCQNVETLATEEIYFNSPVLRLMFL